MHTHIATHMHVQTHKITKLMIQKVKNGIEASNPIFKHLLNSNDLISAGWPSCPVLDMVLTFVDLINQGIGESSVPGTSS